MSMWRRRAIAMLPEWRREIADAQDPMDLWLHLWDQARDTQSKEGGACDVIRRLFLYADECRGARDPNVRTAVVVAFYEHILTEEWLVPHLPNYLSRSVFIEMQDFLPYHVDQSRFENIRREFLSVAK